uniref:glycosyltransferase n=2 Tax=Pseudomonadati TaxID=3379134 RepID=UPI0028A90E65
GFGLPLIEAAQRQLPIVARDIPVFREVAGEHAHYFDGKQTDALKQALLTWLELNSKGLAPQSKNMPWLTWKQSSENLFEAINLS